MLLVRLVFSLSVECGGFRMCPVLYVLSSFAIISLMESEMVARACVLAGVCVCVFQYLFLLVSCLILAIVTCHR